MRHLGVDMALSGGDLVATAAGDAAIVSGVGCLAQDLGLRLATPRGDLWRHPGYGVSVTRYLQAEDTALNRLAMAMEIERAVAADPRVVPGSVSVDIASWARDEIQVRVACQAAAGTNPLNLVVGYGPDVITVEVLRGLEGTRRA